MYVGIFEGEDAYRLIFEAKIIDPTLPGHVAIDDVIFKPDCQYVTQTSILSNI